MSLGDVFALYAGLSLLGFIVSVFGLLIQWASNADPWVWLKPMFICYVGIMAAAMVYGHGQP